MGPDLIASATVSLVLAALFFFPHTPVRVVSVISSASTDSRSDILSLGITTRAIFFVYSVVIVALWILRLGTTSDNISGTDIQMAVGDI